MPVFFIDNIYYKNRIIVSNRKAIDDSDFVICYVDKSKRVSGAKKAMKYAEKNNKKNL